MPVGNLGEIGVVGARRLGNSRSFSYPKLRNEFFCVHKDNLMISDSRRLAYCYSSINSILHIPPKSNLLCNSVMDIKQIRKLHLCKAVDAYGTIKALADATGADASHLSQLNSGHRNIGDKFARKMEDALGLEYGAWDQPPKERHEIGERPEAYKNTTPAEIKGWIPLISYVQAGQWTEAIDLYAPGYAEHVLPTTAPHSLHTFALQVEGASMTLPAGVEGRSFPHGMIIYVDPEKEALPGDYVVARYNGDDRVTFKRLMTEEGRPILVPLNPDRQNYPIIRDEFEVIGKVIDASWGGL